MKNQISRNGHLALYPTVRDVSWVRKYFSLDVKKMLYVQSEKNFRIYLKNQSLVCVTNGISNGLIHIFQVLLLIVLYSDYNYFRNENTGDCELFGPAADEPAMCKTGDSYKGSSGFRKIATSNCKDGIDLASKKVDRICGKGVEAPSKKISFFSTFMKYKLSNYFYFKDSSHILLRDSLGYVKRSLNAGKDWQDVKEFENSGINRIISDPMNSENRAFAISQENFFFVTTDQGKYFKKIVTPTPPNSLGISSIITHVDDTNYVIWVGEKDCEGINQNCRAVAFVSTDSGYSWREIQSYVSRCAFGKDKNFKLPSKETIFCQKFDVTTGNQRKMGSKTSRKLVKSSDFGRSWSDVLSSTINFVTSYDYMVAAQVCYDNVKYSD